MTYLTQQAKWALEVADTECPHCGVAAGVPCRTSNGLKAGGPHMPRLILARGERRRPVRLLDAEQWAARRAEQLLTGQEP